MAKAGNDSSSTDDLDCWQRMAEELLDIDNLLEDGPSHAHRKTSNVSIVLTEDKEEGDTADPTEASVALATLDPSLLTVEHIYIFDDGDSEILSSDGEACDLEEGGCSRRNSRASDRGIQGLSCVEDDTLNQTLCITDDYRQATLAMCDLITTQDMDGIDAFIDEHQEDIGAICLVSDDSGTTPVTAAASLGCLETLQKLSEAGVWLHCSDTDGYIAIHRAAENGHSDVVQWLAEQGQWTATTKDEQTALHVAAQCGQYQVINVLLNYVTSLDLDARGVTPLHLAVQNGHTTVTELLLGKGADINRVNGKGRTPLHLAAEAGNLAMVDLLLMYSADLNSRLVGSGKSALHLAVENNHQDVICKLVEQGASVDIPDNNCETVLHKLHASKLPSECVACLCEKSEDIDQKTRKGRSALFVAVENGNIQVSTLLIENGANPNLEVATGCTPLYAATHHGHWDIVEKLLLAGANPDKQTDNGSTPLYKASRNGLYHIVALLLCHGAKANIARKTGWTPLHVAVHHGHSTIVEQLLAAGANPNAADNQGQTPLAIAAYCKSVPVVNVLKKCANDSVTIYNVAKLGNSEVLKFLVSCGMNLEAQNPVCGWRALHHAAVEGNNRAVSALVSAKVDVNSQDSDGFMPVHLATLHKHASTVELLLNLCCYASIPSKRGETCLSIAVRRGYFSILQVLLRHSIPPDEVDADGKHLLDIALELGHKSVARLLVAHGAMVNAYDDSLEAVAPVRLVCQYGDSELLKMMANRGARIEQRDVHNNTLLHTAAYHGKLDIVLELVTMRGSLVNAQNSRGKQALHLAAAQGHALVVESLLSAGSKVTIMDSDDTVSYEMAKHKEVWEVLKHWASVRPAMLVPPLTQREPSAPDRSQFV